MKNKFKPRYPFGHAAARVHTLLRLEICIIKPDKEKLGGGLYIQPVTVLRGEQKQVTLTVIKFITVDAVPARTVDNIHQLKKIMPVRRFKTFVGFFINNFERLVQVLGHTRKGTEQTQNYTGPMLLTMCNFAVQLITWYRPPDAYSSIARL